LVRSNKWTKFKSSFNHLIANIFIECQQFRGISKRNITDILIPVLFDERFWRDLVSGFELSEYKGSTIKNPTIFFQTPTNNSKT